MPSASTRRKRKKEFADITGASDSVAQSVLEENGWKVQEAVNHYFNNRHRYPDVKEGQPAKLEKIFKQYADKEDEQIMSEDGMMKFFRDVGVNPEGAETLAVAWKLQCEEMGIFQKDEFVAGFAKAGCSSIGDIKGTCQQVCSSLNSSDEFKKFYRWVFIHVKEDEKKKTVPTELAVQLWQIILKGKDLPLFDEWVKFTSARQEKELQAVSKDLWEQIFDFLQEVRSIDSFEDNGAWPIAVDEFVECLQEKK